MADTSAFLLPGARQQLLTLAKLRASMSCMPERSKPSRWLCVQNRCRTALARTDIVMVAGVDADLLALGKLASRFRRGGQRVAHGLQGCATDGQHTNYFSAPTCTERSSYCAEAVSAPSRRRHSATCDMLNAVRACFCPKSSAATNIPHN